MIRLFYWLYRKIYILPCRMEVMEILMEGKSLSPGIYLVCTEYSSGYSIDVISFRNKITRERVRQYLCKAVRS
jgi:hypothetical protein